MTQRRAAHPFNAHYLTSSAILNGDKVWTQTADWIWQSDAQVAAISAEQFAGVPPSDLTAALRKYLPWLAETAQLVAYVHPHTQASCSTCKCTKGFQPGVTSSGIVSAFALWSEANSTMTTLLQAFLVLR